MEACLASVSVGVKVGATASTDMLVHMFDTMRVVDSVRVVEPVRLETIEDAVLPEAGEPVYAGFPSPAQDYWCLVDSFGSADVTIGNR